MSCFNREHSPQYPLYWQKPSRFPPRPDHQLTPEEKRAIDASRQLPRPLRSRALLYLPLVEDPDALFLGISIFTSIILTNHIAYPSLCFAEIIGNVVDMKKLRARIGGRCDLTAELQGSKKKKVSNSGALPQPLGPRPF